MTAMPLLRPRPLREGDLIGLFNPSGAVYERAPYQQTRRALEALGFRVREAPNARARYGHMAGTPQQRADDIHALLDDDEVAGLLAITGGSGANRVLPLLDYPRFRRRPKFVGGYSDLTALITAVHVSSGLVTFHAPLGRSDWTPFTAAHFRAVAMSAEPCTLPLPVAGEPAPEPPTVIRGGRASGPLIGGNLAVLCSLAGTPYWPPLDGAILFLEDVNEYVYRVDRMLSTLALGGHLDRVAGVVLGGFTNCGPSEGSFGTLTLDEVFDDYFAGLGVPVLRGAPFGHVARKMTLPLGVRAELDADAGSLRLLEGAVG